MAEAILVKGGYSESNTKTLLFENVIVPNDSNTWKEDTSPTKSADYPYKGTVTCAGMTDKYIPEVVFGINDAISGNFAPICDSGTDVVYIFAKNIPESSITIASIRGTMQV